MFRTYFIHAILLSSFGIMADANAQKTDTPIPIHVTSARRITIVSEKRYTGLFIPQAELQVFANIPGNIVELHAKPGQLVTKGEILARSNAREANIAAIKAEAALIQAQAQLTTTTANAQARIEAQLAVAQEALLATQARLEETKSLAEMRIRNQLTQAEAAYKAAEATHARAKVNAQQATKRAKAELDKTELDFNRNKALHEKQHISDSDFEAAETRLKVSKTRYQEALASLNQFQDGTAQLAVQKAKTELEVARKVVQSRGWEREIATAQSKLNQAQATLTTAQKLVDAKAWEREIAIAQSAVKQAEEQLKLARQHLNNAAITSPINGVIVSRNVELGDYAKPPSALGSPIFTVISTDSLTAAWSIPAQELSKIEIGQMVLISTSTGIQNIVGTIDFISPTFNKQDNTVLVHATLSKPERKSTRKLLKPGATITVAVKTDERKDVQLLPLRAVIHIQNATGEIFIVNGNTTQRKQINVGAIYGSEIEVTSKLTLKTQVIVDNQHLLQDGTPITIAPD